MAKGTGNAFDVVCIGAGISGINTAYRLQTQTPHLSYTILENRSAMGGTWDLFKYPGIRSDSDLYTFGFPFRPWQQQHPIADGASIMKYINDTAEEFGIDKHIQYQHRVNSVSWKSDQQHWVLDVLVNGSEKKTIYAKFIVLGTGYYNYNEPLAATIPGIENFGGSIVHPQFWPQDLDYTGKKVVIIGSGATAITMLPAMTDKAEKVTMLQRSPSYVVNQPQSSPIDQFLRRILPAAWAFKVIRMRFFLLGFLFFNFCHYFPNAARNALRKDTIKELPKNIPHDPHFEPSYSPWQQRMCMAPSGDFYEALRNGKGDVATGVIKEVTDHAISLESGQVVDADIIITATGLKVRFGGGIQMYVDEKPVNMSDKYVWKGALLQDVPNFIFVMGYVNASWTLGSDATAQLTTRLLNTMRSRKMTSVVPRATDASSMEERPSLNLSSTYLKIALKTGAMPKAGSGGPWKARSNYMVDMWNAKWGDLNTGLQFYRVSSD